MVKQTAGRDSLGDFAPKFAELNDDILFGEVWSREDIRSGRCQRRYPVPEAGQRKGRHQRQAAGDHRHG